MCQINWIRAFDGVDWYFVFSALTIFGYGDKFIHMIKVAFQNIQSKIKINDPYLASLPLCEEFTKGVYSQIAVEVLASFIDND